MSRSLHLLLLAAACGPTSGATTDATGSTGDVTTSAGTTMSEQTGGTTSTGPEPTSAGTTALSTSTTDESGTTGEPGTSTSTTDSTGAETTGGGVCEEPDAEQVEAQWAFEFPNGVDHQNISAECVVQDIGEIAPGDAVATLECAGIKGSVLLSFIRKPVRPLPLLADDVVQLEYREEPIFWINRWFSMHLAGAPAQMPLAGISADHIEPPGATVEQFYDAALTVKDGLCAPVPDGLCGEHERLALVHPLPRPPHAVYDGQFFGYADAAADYDLWLATASRPVEPVQCEDVPPAWFQALMTSSFGP